jgi:hypothetical protein
VVRNDDRAVGVLCAVGIRQMIGFVASLLAKVENAVVGIRFTLLHLLKLGIESVTTPSAAL